MADADETHTPAELEEQTNEEVHHTRVHVYAQ
jgi:hypothetical protein